MSQYQIKLDPKILSRARLVLGSLLLLLTVFAVTGTHQGIVSGYFEKTFIKPFKDFGSEFEKRMNASPNPQPNLTIVYPSPKVEPYTPAIKQPAPAPVSVPTPAPVRYPVKSYEQVKKEQDEWWANVQQQNRDLSRQSQQELEQFRQQSQENLKQFEQEGQAGLEQFRKENEQKMEEFRQKYGIQ